MVRIVRRTLTAVIALSAIAGLAVCAYAQTHPATPPPAASAKPAAASAAKPAPGAPATTGTGRITGHALEKGKEPVSFANVIVLGLKLGAQTDETGAFIIDHVPVGSYQIQLMAIGYEKVVQAVQVNAGQTAVINFTVGDTKVVKEIETIEVRAEKRIDTKSSTTKQAISAEKLKEIPVDNLSEAVATRAGIVAQGGELHFRGGRGGEVKTQFDGVEATDPAFGSTANIANLAIAGADVISGGFDAEYGNALSGVVAVSTKEGTNRLGGEVRWDTDRFGDPTKTYDNYDRFTFGFGGPTPVKNLTYFATYEGTFTNTYLNSGMSLPKRTLLDFITLGNRQSNQVNTNFKLAYRVNPRNKVTFETINNHSIDTPYLHDWSRKGYVAVSYNRNPDGTLDTANPKYGSWSASPGDTSGGVSYQYVNLADHVPTSDNRFQQFAGVWTDQVSDKSVWTTRVASQSYNLVQTVGGEEPWEYWIQNPFYWSGNIGFGTENNPYYATHGDVPQYLSRSTDVYTIKSDFSTRHWKQHTWKTGFEAKYNRVQNLSLTSPNGESNGLPGATRSDYLNFNPEGAAYVQDRWEFEGLVLNAGLRYDFFTPGAQIQDSDLKSGKRYKAQFSPRLGIAYPISDRDVLSFHYGWTYQTPASALIFENRGISSTVGIKGNPDLEPETNIAYQAGVQHLFTKDISGQFSVFFKDIYGLITVRQDKDQAGNLVNVYYNGDYASARGFEASMIKSFSHKFSTDINYTYSIATGVASDPNTALQFFNGGKLYLPISEQPLNWDQRHTVSVGSTIREPGKWGMRMLWTYGSGFPFTPAFRNDRRPDPVLTNSRRLPSAARLTLDADKFYKVWGQNLTVFLDARNVLDATNITNIQQNTLSPFVNTAGQDYTIYYTETGRAGGAYLQDTNGDNVLDWVPVHDPRVFEEGRSVRLGINVTF